MGCGYARHAYQAKTVSDPSQSTLATRWQPNLPAEGNYDLYVHVPVCPSKRAITTAARYVIQHRDGAVEVAVNQATQTGWVLLGRFPFKAGSDGFIQLSDLAGDEGTTVWFDQAKWVILNH
jgi:hyaluronate lyase